MAINNNGSSRRKQWWWGTCVIARGNRKRAEALSNNRNCSDLVSDTANYLPLQGPHDTTNLASNLVSNSKCSNDGSGPLSKRSKNDTARDTPALPLPAMPNGKSRGLG